MQLGSPALEGLIVLTQRLRAQISLTVALSTIIVCIIILLNSSRGSSLLTHVEVGMEVPELTLSTNTGEAFVLNPAKDRVTVLVFTNAGKCKSDKASLAAVEQLKSQYDTAPVDFYAVVNQPCNQQPIAILVDDGSVAATLGVKNTPVCVVIDEANVLAHRGPVNSQGTHRFLGNAVQTVLNGQLLAQAR